MRAWRCSGGLWLLCALAVPGVVAAGESSPPQVDAQPEDARDPGSAPASTEPDLWDEIERLARTYPAGLVSACAVSEALACLALAPIPLPFAMLAYGASMGSAGQGWGFASAFVCMAVMPISGFLFVAAHLLSPLVVAGGAAVDALLTDRLWRPGVAGAAAGWLPAVASGLVAVAAVGVIGAGSYLVQVSSLMPFVTGGIALLGLGLASTLLMLAPPSAVLGAMVADHELGPPAAEAAEAPAGDPGPASAPATQELPSHE